MMAQAAMRHHREAMNCGDLKTVNAGISDRYLSVFCRGNSGTHEIYNAQEWRGLACTFVMDVWTRPQKSLQIIGHRKRTRKNDS